MLQILNAVEVMSQVLDAVITGRYHIDVWLLLCAWTDGLTDYLTVASLFKSCSLSHRGCQAVPVLRCTVQAFPAFLL
jgi:hypothetical protein